MSLRHAKFKDHWRHVYNRQYSTRFTSISFENLRSLANATVEFNAGINAIVGSNGAGKSTLVAAIAEMLANASIVATGHRNRLKGSRTTGRSFTNEIELSLAVQDDPEGGRIAIGESFEGEFRWLDPSAVATEGLAKVHRDPNFRDLLEGISPIELNADELNIASYLVGKNYTSCKIYEISDYADFERFPYFRTESGNVDYGSEDMGRGELSLLLMYWTLRDLRPHSILILEEPETHVSPRSQECLMNMVAKFCDDKGIWTIVTTQSPSVIPQHSVRP